MATDFPSLGEDDLSQVPAPDLTKSYCAIYFAACPLGAAEDIEAWLPRRAFGRAPYPGLLGRSGIGPWWLQLSGVLIEKILLS